jgi:hypothetical protein
LYEQLWENSLEGSIPTEIGMMRKLQRVNIEENFFSGQLPTHLGFLTNMTDLRLWQNSISGPIPSQVGLLTNLDLIYIHKNELSGTLPSELGLLSAQFFLSDNAFTGTIPVELCPMACEDLVSPFLRSEVSFLGNDTAVLQENCTCDVGMAFPLPNATSEVVLNIRFDLYPEEISWVFEKYTGSNNHSNTMWLEIEAGSGVPEYSGQLHSHMLPLQVKTLYRFQVTDSYGDGT